MNTLLAHIKELLFTEADKVFQTRLLITEIANLIVQYSSFFRFLL